MSHVCVPDHAQDEDPAKAVMRLQAEEQAKAEAMDEGRMAAAVPAHALRALANLLMFEVLSPDLDQVRPTLSSCRHALVLPRWSLSRSLFVHLDAMLRSALLSMESLTESMMESMMESNPSSAQAAAVWGPTAQLLARATPAKSAALGLAAPAAGAVGDSHCGRGVCCFSRLYLSPILRRIRLRVLSSVFFEESG